MDQKATFHPGLLETLRRLAATVLAILQNRIELLLVELQEERARLLNALMLTAVIVSLGLFTVAMAGGALAIAVWHEYGLRGLFALSALGLVGTVLAYWGLRVRLKHWPFLSGTLAELKKDRECLERRK